MTLSPASVREGPRQLTLSRFTQRRVQQVDIRLHLLAAARVDQFPSHDAPGVGETVSGRGQRAFDIVHALAEHDLDGAVNLTSPAPLRNRDFTQQLAKHLHRPALAAVPRLALHGVLGAELADEAILASQRVLPRRLVGEGFQFDHPTFADILSAVLPRRPLPPRWV